MPAYQACFLKMLSWAVCAKQNVHVLFYARLASYYSKNQLVRIGWMSSCEQIATQYVVDTFADAQISNIVMYKRATSVRSRQCFTEMRDANAQNVS